MSSTATTTTKQQIGRGDGETPSFLPSAASASTLRRRRRNSSLALTPLLLCLCWCLCSPIGKLDSPSRLLLVVGAEGGSPPPPRRRTKVPRPGRELHGSKRTAAVASKPKTKPSLAKRMLDDLFGNASCDRREGLLVVAAAALFSLNAGFLNGITVSSAFLAGKEAVRDKNSGWILNPGTEMVAGCAGSVTRNARAFADFSTMSPVFWYTLGLLGAYGGGAALAGFLNKETNTAYALEPRYGTSFLLAGVLLTAAQAVVATGGPSALVFFAATASLGIQNGVVSLYSANLIRCTMTGVATDAGLALGRCLHGDYRTASAGAVRCGIIAFFWAGGMLASPSVASLGHRALWINAGVFYGLGLGCAVRWRHGLGGAATLWQAMLGSWNPREAAAVVLGSSPPALAAREGWRALFSGDDRFAANRGARAAGREQARLTEAEFLARLRRHEGLGQGISAFRARLLFRAADVDQDGTVGLGEWEAVLTTGESGGTSSSTE
ncbi:unnamed protein product [Pseudo-nitzschia multistriata]|uniref:EF-hand domain-containing protein n=1 Tax=Pseudo-nitzschia multistriata TaxID=183589 RepID=A0A448ZA91_9STRA|nr:unnamed protein product [Pseudo-nitzschia multistriata]